jgi:hypothetical protein
MSILTWRAGLASEKRRSGLTGSRTKVQVSMQHSYGIRKGSLDFMLEAIRIHVGDNMESYYLVIMIHVGAFVKAATAAIDVRQVGNMLRTLVPGPDGWRKRRMNQIARAHVHRAQ